MELLEGLELFVVSTLAALEGLVADGATLPFLLLTVLSPADDGRLLLVAICNPPLLGLGPLGLRPPPPGCG